MEELVLGMQMLRQSMTALLLLLLLPLLKLFSHLNPLCRLESSSVLTDTSPKCEANCW